MLERLPRPVYVRAQTLAAGTHFTTHQHDWVQFLYASSGTLRVRLPTGSFAVLPKYAVWIPTGMPHDVATFGKASFRSLYIDPTVAGVAGTRCRVVEVTALVRELISAATLLPVEYEERGRDGRLIATLLDEIAALTETDVHLPMPVDSRLRHICDVLLAEPADPRGLDEWADTAGASTRTLARLFIKETGMGFREWRQRLRLHSALERIAGGVRITVVALEVGYSSTSAFIAAFKEHFGRPPGELSPKPVVDDDD